MVFLIKFFRLIYTQIFLRFSCQIRDPYLIRIDNIFVNNETNELCLSFHIANKRINQVMTVSEFIKTDMLYLIDPKIVFNIGNQFGVHSEKIILTDKEKPSLRSKCLTQLKRVFIDE